MISILNHTYLITRDTEHKLLKGIIPDLTNSEKNLTRGISTTIATIAVSMGPVGGWGSRGRHLQITPPVKLPITVQSVCKNLPTRTGSKLDLKQQRSPAGGPDIPLHFLQCYWMRMAMM